MHTTPKNNNIIPINAHSFEVFAIKGKQAFIGFKLVNNDFHYIQVPYTVDKSFELDTNLRG